MVLVGLGCFGGWFCCGCFWLVFCVYGVFGCVVVFLVFVGLCWFMLCFVSVVGLLLWAFLVFVVLRCVGAWGGCGGYCLSVVIFFCLFFVL